VVGLIPPGTTVPVEIMRDKKRKKLKVTVGGLGADDSYALNSGDGDEGRGGRLGLIVEAATPDVLERWGINGGVLVREVVTGSVASEAGVMSGDMITLVGNSPIKTVDAYERAVEKLPNGSSVPLRLIRRGAPMFIGLKLQD
jgi:serine protease Do